MKKLLLISLISMAAFAADDQEQRGQKRDREEGNAAERSSQTQRTSSSTDAASSSTTNSSTTSSNSSAAFREACRTGNYAEVQQLLGRINLEEKDEDGRTPIYIASNNGHLEVVQALLENGADVNAPNNRRHTPLFAASRYGYTEVVQTLLNASADVNFLDRIGWTPLHEATYGHMGVVKALLEAGANVNATADRNDGKIYGSGVTPLLNACHYGYDNISVVQALLQAGADKSGGRPGGRITAFYIANILGHTDICKLLQHFPNVLPLTALVLNAIYKHQVAIPENMETLAQLSKYQAKEAIDKSIRNNQDKISKYN